MAKIERVVIDIGGNEITLSLDEVKELQDILNKTFPKKEKEYVTIPYPYPVIEKPYYSRPYIYWTCGTSDTSDTLTISQTSLA